MLACRIFIRFALCFGIVTCAMIEGFEPRTHARAMPIDSIRCPAEMIHIPEWNISSVFFHVVGLFDITLARSGLANGPGIQDLEAMRFAVNKVNSDASLLTNAKLTYSIYDAQGLDSAALAPVLSELNSDTTIVIIGPPLSSQTFVVTSATQNYDVCVLSFSATASRLNGQETYPFGRLVTNDDEMINALIALIQAMGWNLIIPIFSSDAYGAYGRSRFISAAKKANITLTCDSWIVSSSMSEVITEETINTIQTISDCIANSIANVVLLYMDPVTASYVLSIFNENPKNERLTFLATDAWFGFQQNPAHFESVVGFPISFLQGSIAMLPAIGDYLPFQQYFSELTPENNGYYEFIVYWQNLFRCVYNDTSMPVCPENISERFFPLSCSCTGNETLASVSIDYSTTYVCDAVFAIAQALNLIVNNCSSIIYDDYCDKTQITGSDLYEVIRRLNFVGYTGADYNVVQTAQNGSGVIIGYCIDGNVTLDPSSFCFKGGQVPSSSIVYASVDLSSAIGITVTVMSVIIIVLSLVSMVIFWIHHRNPVVKKSSPLFCQLILAGIIITLIGVMILGVRNNSLACIFELWFFVIGLGLILANLLAKSYRIFLVYSTLSTPSDRVSDKQLLKFTAFILVCEVVLLSLYTFPSGLPQAEIVVSTVDPLYSYPVCSINDDGLTICMTVLLIVFNFAMVILIGLIAYMTRHVDSAYNESAHIAIVIYSYILIIAVVIPLYFGNGTGSGSAERRYAERSFAAILLLFITWACIMAPKICRIFGIFPDEPDVSGLVFTSDSRINELPSDQREKVKFMSRKMWQRHISTVGASRDMLVMGSSNNDTMYDTTNTTDPARFNISSSTWSARQYSSGRQGTTEPSGYSASFPLEEETEEEHGDSSRSTVIQYQRNSFLFPKHD